MVNKNSEIKKKTSIYNFNSYKNESLSSFLLLQPVYCELLLNGRGFANDHWAGLFKKYFFHTIVLLQGI